MKFFKYSQNNSGGNFHVDDKICHNVIIEAESASEADDIAESLGCYFDGCSTGRDCSCCGDRWSKQWNDDGINLEKLKNEGYVVSAYNSIGDAKSRWDEKYRKYNVLEEPKLSSRYACYEGKISFNNIEEYIQFLANEHGWTTPDARIYYKNGTVKEIFSQK